MATRSARKDVNYTIDDNFDGVEKTVRGPRIDEQIMASYQTNCIKEAATLLSPEKLKELEEWESMTPEQLLEALQNVQSDESTVLEQKYFTELAQEYTSVLEASDDVYAFLEKYDIKNSANNVLAASRLLDNPSNVFDMLFNTEGKSVNYQEMIADMKNTLLENFGEAVKTPEEMAKAQATLAEVAEKVMQTMIIENEPVSVKDLKSELDKLAGNDWFDSADVKIAIGTQAGFIGREAIIKKIKQSSPDLRNALSITIKNEQYDIQHRFFIYKSMPLNEDVKFSDGSSLYDNLIFNQRIDNFGRDVTDIELTENGKQNLMITFSPEDLINKTYFVKPVELLRYCVLNILEKNQTM